MIKKQIAFADGGFSVVGTADEDNVFTVRVYAAPRGVPFEVPLIAIIGDVSDGISLEDFCEACLETALEVYADDGF